MTKDCRGELLTLLSQHREMDIAHIRKLMSHRTSRGTIMKYLRLLEAQGKVEHTMRDKPFPSDTHTVLTTYWKKKDRVEYT